MINEQELQLAARNHGMPLEALRYDVTPPGLHYVLTHYDIPAVDPSTKSVYMNSSDGYMYRWDLSTNTLKEKINLNAGYYQSYTPIAFGPDGKIYGINNAVLIAIGK